MNIVCHIENPHAVKKFENVFMGFHLNSPVLSLISVVELSLLQKSFDFHQIDMHMVFSSYNFYFEQVCTSILSKTWLQLCWSHHTYIGVYFLNE